LRNPTAHHWRQADAELRLYSCMDQPQPPRSSSAQDGKRHRQGAKSCNQRRRDLADLSRGMGVDQAPRRGRLRSLTAAAGKSSGWNSSGNDSNLLTHHRFHCHGSPSIDDGAGGRHDADTGVSRHRKLRTGGREARTSFHGHHRQLHEPHGPALLRHHIARINVRFRAMRTLSRHRRMTESDPHNGPR
jgi:hypothetical protein